jgi:hypothetical protein
MIDEKNDLGADAAAVDEAGAIVPASTASHAAPTIWAVWMPFKKSGFPSLGTFGARERKVVIVPMETWNALCAEIPALQTKRFNVGSYE